MNKFIKSLLLGCLITGAALAQWAVTPNPGDPLHISVTNIPGSAATCQTSFAGTVPSADICTTVTASQDDILKMADPATYSCTPNPCVPYVLVAGSAGNVIFPTLIRWKHTFVSQNYIEPGNNGPSVFWENNSNAFASLLGNDGGNILLFASGSTPTTDASYYSSGWSALIQTGVDSSANVGKDLVLQAGTYDTMNRGPYLSAVVGDSGGTVYALGDLITLAGDGVLEVSGVSGGVVNALTVSTAGTANLGGTGQGFFPNQPASNLGNVTSGTVHFYSGSGYSNGDTGTINCGDGMAVYVVASSTSGNVLTVTVSGGSMYTSITPQCGTSVVTGGGDGMLALDIESVTGDAAATAQVTGPGNGYAVNDTGLLVSCSVGGDDAATYTVTGESMGHVTGLTVSGGGGYLSSVCGTMVSTGMGDGSLYVDVLAATGSGLTVNPTVQPGDGTVTIQLVSKVLAQ